MARFLDGTLDFPGIPRLLEAAVARFGGGADQAPDVHALIALDAEVRGGVRDRPRRRAARMIGFAQSSSRSCCSS